MFLEKKVLITGTHSFIGSYFKLHAPKHYLIDEVSLRDNGLHNVDFSHYDTVFHVAAIVHQTSKVPDAMYFEVNTNLAEKVAQKAKADGVKQFVFMSTVKVYGETSSEASPWREDSPCHPSDAYGKSKLAAENLIRQLNDKDFKVSIIRTPVVYGAGVKGNINRIAKYIATSNIIPLKGIQNKRAMIYIGNLMAMIYRIIDLRQDGLFLAADRRNISTSELAEFMIKACEGKKLFIAIPKFVQFLIKRLSPKNYTRLFGSMVIDSSVTFEKLAFEPPFLVAEGIQEVMDDIC